MSIRSASEIASKLKELAEQRVALLNQVIALYDAGESVVSADTITKHHDIASIGRAEQKIEILLDNLRTVIWACAKL